MQTKNFSFLNFVGSKSINKKRKGLREENIRCLVYLLSGAK